MDKFKPGDSATVTKDFIGVKTGEVVKIRSKYDDYGRMKDEAWWVDCPNGAQVWLPATAMDKHGLTIQPSQPAFQVGDIVEAINSYPGYFTQGRLYKVTNVSLLSGSVPWLDIEVCDTGGASSWAACNFQFHSSANIPAIASHSHMPTGTIVLGDPVPAKTNLSLNDLGKTEVEQYVEEHYKSAEQERKERIWRALQGAAKQ